MLQFIVILVCCTRFCNVDEKYGNFTGLKYYSTSLIETGDFHQNSSMVMSPEIYIDAPNITIKEGNKKEKKNIN
jgi:hypothetical protein